MLKEITYTAPNGKDAHAAYITNGSAYQLGSKHERFAQLLATGADIEDAYCTVYDVELTPDTVAEIHRKAKRLCTDTSIALRVQELKRPVLRKLHRKIEYSLQKALEQCEVAWDLAYLQADVKGLLAAVKMQADLSKLLSTQIDVTHKHGLLDNEQTEVLLAMQKEFAVRHAKKKELMKIRVEKVETVGETPV